MTTSLSLMPQQRQQERECEQCGHTLPELDRGAFIERPRPVYRKWCARRSRLHLHCEFIHVAKAFGGIDCDCSPERALEPGREIRAQGGERFRPLPAWRAGRIDIAVRKFARG